MAALEVNQPLQRAQLLGWIVDWFKGHEMTPGLDLSGWVAPIVGVWYFLQRSHGLVRSGPATKFDLRSDTLFEA